VPSPRPILFALFLLLAIAPAASAQDDAGSRAVSGDAPRELDQVLYKGLVGNVLDAIPMDPSKRLDLQRTNAVVGSAFLGRSMAVLVGLSNPVMLLGGLAWGVWAASNIRQEDIGMKLTAGPRQPGSDAATQEQAAALPAFSPAADDAAAISASRPILVSSISDAAALSQPHVVKIWPTQRPPILLQ
jgi:hypothetical protein